MFYNIKFLFFIIMYCFSAVLCYFINQQVLLIGIFENLIFSTTVIFLSIISVSYILSLLLTMLFIFLTGQKFKDKKSFISWLLFTVVSYAAVFTAFSFATAY